MAVRKRCIRCLYVMRNDGTKENPKWVCNNQNCVRYVRPKDEMPSEDSSINTTETPSDDTDTPSTGDNA